jgi:hypothetical protein
MDLLNKISSRLEEDIESLGMYYEKNKSEIDKSAPKSMRANVIMIADSFRAYFYKEGLVKYFFKYKIIPFSKYKLSSVRKLDMKVIGKLLAKLAEVEEWKFGEEDKKKVLPISN